MKSLMSQTEKMWIVLCVAMFGFVFGLDAQIPQKPNPPRLVNDFAGVFTPQQAAALEDSLVRFSKRTSNQVTIVTVNDLAGMEASQFAYEIGEKWGVGSSKLDNGVVLLIKPKNKTKGQVFIATGYGVEGVLPDASCSRIINNEMIPSFKIDDYFGGTVKALNVILPVLAKEYSVEEYENADFDNMIRAFMLVIAGMVLVFVIIFLLSKDQDNRNDRNGNSGTFGGGNNGTSGDDIAAAVLLGSLLGGRSYRRSGGGSFGGFGGFGGGSFGGGGAGGSW